MTREEYLAFHKSACEKMIAITQKKNADYTGASDDPFYNFSRVEAVGICSVEQGFLTRMFDKFSRITTFVQKGVLQVEDESVQDTLFDLANYCVLMAGYIKSKRDELGESEPQIDWLKNFDHCIKTVPVTPGIEARLCDKCHPGVGHNAHTEDLS